MYRRAFIGPLAGGILVAPLVTCAQTSSMPVIEFLSSFSHRQWSPFVAALRQGLNVAVYVEGKNVAVEFRWTEGQLDRLPAADLVSRPVAIIVATGGSGSELPAKAATSTTPIVFGTDGDSVEQGHVPSLCRRPSC